MSKTSLAKTGYQKYFDPKSLKSVASCAAMVFIIIHLIDYLWGFSIPIRILNFITLSLCLLITFLFVVKEVGKIDEKIVLGLANAALLFFSVIGFNSTITSNGFSAASNISPSNSSKKVEKIDRVIRQTDRSPVNASLLPILNVRNWMPPAELERRLDTLTKNNHFLNFSIQSKVDSLSFLRKSIKTNDATNLDRGCLERYETCSLQVDSIKRQNSYLLSELQKYKGKSVSDGKSISTITKTSPDTSSMDKANYIQSYRIMKEKFENDLKRCQQEAAEYKSKYNILIRQSNNLMNGIRSNDN